MLLRNSLAKAEILVGARTASYVKLAVADMLTCGAFAYACNLQRLHAARRATERAAAIRDVRPEQPQRSLPNVAANAVISGNTQ